MGKIKQTTTKVIRKSKTTTGSTGRVYCRTCGSYLGNKGKR